MAYKSKFMKEREKESAQNQTSEASSSVSVRSDSAGVSGAQFKSKFFQAGGHVNPSAVAPAKSNWAVPEKAEEQKKRANTGNVTADILADSGADWLSKQFSFERSMDMENQAFGSPVWRKKYGAMPDAEQRKAVQDLQDKHKFLTAKGYSEDAAKVQEELDWLYTYGGSSAQAAGRKAERSRNETRIVQLDNDIQALYDEMNTGLGVETASGAPSMDPVRQKIRELEDERNKLRTQNAQYDRTYGVMDSYQPVRTADDFGYLSAVRPLRNPIRDQLLEIDASGADIPFVDRLGLFLGASELEKEQAMAVPYDQEGTWETILKDGFDGSWDMLEQDEIQVYYYLLNKYGTEKADQYLADMKPELNRRSTAERAKFIDNASGMQKLALNVASVPASVFGGIPAYMEDAAALLQGKDINPYSSAHAMSNEAQATRASTAQKIDKKTGNASLLGVTFGDAYQAAMSGADSLFGGGFLGAAGYGLAMGMGAASTKARDLYEQGATNEQIAAGSLLAGAAEMVFEKYSIEKLFELKDAKTVLQVVKNALIQGGVEASEESFTEISNTITDAIVRGNQSDWSRSIRGYKEDGKSEEEATALALLDVGMNVWKAAAGGFISGTLMGGTATAINYAGSRTDSKQNTKNQNDPILAAAMEIAGAETSQNRKTSSEVKEDTQNEKPAQAVAQTATEAETAVQTQEQDRWNQAADRAFGETGQKAFRAVNDGSLDPADLYAGFAVYHHAGMMGRDINTITSPYAKNFPENYRKIAYDAGVADSASSVKARTDAAVTATVYGKEAGVIANDYSKSMDQNVVQTLDSVAKSIGRKVIVEDLGSETNGFVDSDGVIHLDIHAENPHLVVAAHEITHVMEDLAPAEHKRYRDYVMNALADANGGSVLELVEAQKEAYAGKQKLSDEQAMNELVADYTKRMMENKDLFSDFAKKDRTAAQKLLDAVKKFLQKVNAVFTGNRQAQNEAAQREFGMDISMVEEAAKLWQDALEASQAQAQTANKNTDQQSGENRYSIKWKKKLQIVSENLTQNNDGVITKEDGTPVAAVYGNGSSRLSLKTYKEGGRSFYEEYLEKQVKNKNLTAAEAADMLQQLDAIYDICNGYRNKYVPFSAWSDAAVQVDSKGNPVFSVIKKNGEYSMNLDFSLVCKKRRTLDGVFNLMVKNGMIDKIAMGEADIVKINDIIRSHGFETACALCFVDAKRFRQANVALQFADVYNDMVKSMIPEGSNLKVGYHNFGGNTYLPNVTGGIDTMADSALDMTHINEVLAGAPKKKANWTVEHKVADYLKRNPADRKLVDVGDFMSTAGFEQAQKTKPGIMGLYNAKKGSGGPKAAFGDVQYLNDILKRSTAFNAKKAYAIGGVRVQSFSDYVPRMVFDYVQMVSELAAKKLPAHAYTKEPLFAMQYGMTGMKINLSLIPKVVDGGIAPGLDANGNYVWADESFPYDVAVQIQDAKGYSANCGTICVGVSDEHIRTLMADESIRMVIPYHKSGLNHIVASMNKIDQFEDYTNVQNTRYADSGTKLSKADANKETGYNERLRELGDPRKAAEAYVRWCEENNYLPKFDQFAYMQIDGEYVVDDDGKRVVDENYYKLLEDFTGYDNGIYAPQGAVTMTFPKEGDAFGSMAELIEQGLEEDAILEAKRTEKLPEIVREIGEAFGVERNAAETSDVSASEEAAELSDTNIRYSLRKKDPPKKTGVAYKVFLAKDGQLYPPMVANPGGEGTPVGVWLDADIGKSAPPSKTGRPQVQGGGKGTNSGKISLAFRPGWHLGDIPLAKQFAQLNPDTEKKELFPANFVWAECEYAMDEDYQEEAMSYGYTENGKFRHSYAGLPRLPEDGYYRYRTNPNPDTVPWIITGAMRVKRILTDAETDAICRENGVEPMARKCGPIDLEKFGLSAGDVVQDQEGRYSRKGGSVVDAAAARAEDVEALKSQLAHWKSQVKLTKGFKVDSKDVASLAKKLIRTYQADTDAKALAQKLQELYDGIASGYYGNKEIDFETAKARSEEIAKTIVENAVETENEMYVEYAELRKYLRGVTLNISAEDSHDIPDFNDFRKRNFGRMRIGSDGTNIDTVYKELSTLWPEFFDEQQETTPSDQLLQIAEVMDAVYRTQEVNPFARYAEEAVSDIADEVMANFFTLPQAQTFADKAAAKLKQSTADARLAGQMSQGRQDAKQLRKANEQIDLLKVQLKQAKADASKLKQTSAKDAPKLQKANEKVAELEAKLKQATADAILAGQMAQGRMDAALLRRSEERAARAQERAKAALAQEKKRGADAVQKLKDSQAAKTAKSREQRKAAELRGKIIRHSRDMSQKLLRPTDKKHVPEELQSAVAAVLNAINLESNYEVEYGTDAKFHHVKPGESPYSEATNRTKAFQQLREAYKKLAGEVVIDPAVISGDGDQAAAGPLLQDVLDMGDIRIVDMNSAQLETVWRVLKAVEQSVSKANKLFLSAKYETISDMASQLESHSVFRKPKKAIKAPKFLGGSGNLTLDLEIPLTFFSQYGDVGEAIYQELRDAQDYQERLTDQLADEVGEIVKPKQVQQLQKEVHTLHTEEGIELKLTTAHIMELYELSKRKQAEDHLLKGGIVQPEIESAKVERGTDMIKLSANDLGEIISKLTPEQKQIADSLQKLLTTTLADAGNRASMQAYGYKKFTGTDYWPIKSAQEALHHKVEKGANNTRSIKNIGLAQQVVPNANTALNLGGIFQTFAGHATDMIDYAAWLCPMEDANRLFNYKYKDANGITTGKTVKGILDKVGGSGSQAYWTNLMEDIQNGIGGPGDSAIAGIAAKVTGNVKGAAVGANIRVVIQQPTAIFRAATILSPANLSKGLAKGVTKGNGWKKALEYSDIAKRKDRGGFEISNPMQMSEILYDDRTGLSRFNDKMSLGAEKADAVTWGKIWNACEWQVHGQNKDLTPGSEAFYQKTAELFADVINQSQVVDGVMQRSQIMRSSNQISKQMTSFMGEPTMSLNMLMRAYDALRYEQDPPKRGKAMKQAARVAGALLVTDIVTALVQSLIDGLRDDDRDKKYLERVLSAFTGVTGEEESVWDQAVGVVISGNLVSTMNPIGRLPYAKDLLSLIQGYSVERMDISAFSDLIAAGTTFVDSLSGDGTKTWAYATKQLAAAGSKVLGISASNILRDVWSIARSIAIETGNLALQYEMEKAIYKIGNEKNDNRYIDILYDAMNSDQEVYRTIYADMVKNGVSADKISKGIEKRMKKDQGVTSVEELTSRYLTPDQEKVYGEAYDRVTGTRVWKAATEDQREKLEDNLYDLTVCNDAGEELREKIDSGKSVGIDEVEYLLYKLAQEVVSEDGNKNTNQSEAEAAAAMLTGLSKAERAWLWQSTNKGWNAKNNPFK